MSERLRHESAVVAAAGRVVQRYADVRVAERDGYRLFGREPVGSEEHYVSLAASAAEKNGLHPERPGSLLYRHDANRVTLVGVMYGAPPNASIADLDDRVPLSIATWHRHVDFCVAPHGAVESDTRFGFAGTIHEPDDCKRAGGYFVPLAFGWMTHVYPNRPASMIWGGETMRPMAM